MEQYQYPEPSPIKSSVGAMVHLTKVASEPVDIDMVNHPPHYTAHPSGLECIDITRGMTFDVGNAVKYVWRADLKNGRQDFDKARWYLVDAIQSGSDSFVSWHRVSTITMLEKVMDHETGLRFRFFDAITSDNLVEALEVVQALLAEGE